MEQQQCLFCGIAHKQVPSYIIYEDDKIIAILDINPLTSGHVLLFPKEHYPVFQAIPQDVMDHLSKAIRLISNTMLKALKATGTNIYNANGVVAGQKAPHVIIHIVPRYDSDGINSFFIPTVATDKEKMEKLREVFVDKIKDMNSTQKSDLEAQLTEKFGK